MTRSTRKITKKASIIAPQIRARLTREVRDENAPDVLNEDGSTPFRNFFDYVETVTPEHIQLINKLFKEFRRNTADFQALELMKHEVTVEERRTFTDLYREYLHHWLPRDYIHLLNTIPLMVYNLTEQFDNYGDPAEYDPLPDYDSGLV